MINSNHIEIVINLKICVFQQIIQNGLAISLFFQLNSYAKTCAIRFIAYFYDAWDFIVNTHIVNLFDQDCFVNFIRNLSDNNLLFTTFKFLDFCPRANNDTSLTCFVGFFDFVSSLDNASCREIWPRQKFHQFL